MEGKTEIIRIIFRNSTKSVTCIPITLLWELMRILLQELPCNCHDPESLINKFL